MKLRVLGLVLTMLLVGSLGGYALAQRAEPAEAETFRRPVPVPAESPRFPGEIETSVQADPEFPTLDGAVELVPRDLGIRGRGGIRLTVPDGWSREIPEGVPGEWKFKPPGWIPHTHFIRVSLVGNQHRTPAGHVAERLRVLRTVVYDLEVEEREEDWFTISYTSGNHRFTASEGYVALGEDDAASVWIGVIGRTEDGRAGQELLHRMTESVEPR